jgi:hypothetical protein
MSRSKTVSELIAELEALPPTLMVRADVWTVWDMTQWVADAVAARLDEEGIAVVHRAADWTLGYLRRLGIDLLQPSIGRRALSCARHGDWAGNAEGLADGMLADLADEFSREVSMLVEETAERSLPLKVGHRYDLPSLDLLGWVGNPPRATLLEEFFDANGAYLGENAAGVRPVVLNGGAA